MRPTASRAPLNGYTAPSSFARELLSSLLPPLGDDDGTTYSADLIESVTRI